jgi:hypothetical protein
MVAIPASAMVEQVNDPRFRRRLGIRDPPPRQDVDDTGVQIQFALFGQLHGHRRKEGFCHRANLKLRIRGNSLVGAYLGDTEAGAVGVGPMDDPDCKPRDFHFLDQLSSFGENRIKGRLALLLCLELLVFLSTCRLNCK